MTELHDTFKEWKENPNKLAEAAKRVELGEFECCYHAGRYDECHNTATHVETITRTFVAFTQVLDLPLCDDHKGYYF